MTHEVRVELGDVRAWVHSYGSVITVGLRDTVTRAHFAFTIGERTWVREAIAIAREVAEHTGQESLTVFQAIAEGVEALCEQGVEEAA